MTTYKKSRDLNVTPASAQTGETKNGGGRKYQVCPDRRGDKATFLEIVQDTTINAILDGSPWRSF